MSSRAALLLFVGWASLSGCGGASDAPAAALPVAAGTPTPAPQPAAQPQPQPPVVPPPPRNDLAELAVKKALMPTVPGGLTAPGTAAPRPRATDFDRGELPLPKVAVQPPPSPLPKARPAFPGPPAERPPLALGDAAAVEVGAFPLPQRALRKAARAANPTAADVPALARQQPDRAPVEDPTVELSAKGVIATSLPLPSFVLPYLKVVIPDPFEYAEHLKGKLGREAEFGTAPAAVPPARR